MSSSKKLAEPDVDTDEASVSHDVNRWQDSDDSGGLLQTPSADWQPSSIQRGHVIFGRRLRVSDRARQRSVRQEHQSNTPHKG